MRRTLLSSALLIPLLISAQQTPDFLSRRLPAARTVVRNYLELDYRGALLAPEPAKKLLALTTWKSDPEWQAVTVISQYEISGARTSGIKRALVTVNYTVIGRYEPGVGFARDTEPQTAEFTLGEDDNGWKILESDPPAVPHVSKPALVQWLRTAWPKEQDPMRKSAMQRTLNQLDPAATAPAAGH